MKSRTSDDSQRQPLIKSEVGLDASFARVLRFSVWGTLGFAIISFGLYLAEFSVVHLPLEQVIEGLAHRDGVKHLNGEGGDDILGLTSLRLLSMTLWLPYLLLVVFFYRRGDWLYLFLSLLQLGVFGLSSFI